MPSARTATLAVVAAIAVINVANMAEIVLGPATHQYLLMDQEANPPTWLSTALFGLTALLLAHLAVRSPRRLEWRVAAGIAAFCSFDEASQVHDRLDRVPGGHFLRFGWVVPASLIILATALVMFRWFRSLELRLRRDIGIAVFLVVLGAVGFEAIGSQYMDAHGDNRTYYLITTVEENLELVGAGAALLALVRYNERTRHA